MEIISFTGKSGTGKSFQAVRICKKLSIDVIIDDGLLICNGRIIAGSSAKKCVSKAAAMRTALFNYKNVREEVQAGIKELKPDKILVLGTSDRMVDWITDTLEIPRATRRIYIEDVTTEEERKTAQKSRNKRGEHVIPVPMVQLKRDFSGYFMNPIRLFRNMAMDDQTGGDKLSERTVMRPAFSYFGDFEISETVFKNIIDITAEKYRNIIHVKNFFNNRNSSSLDLILVINVRTATGLMERCEEFQGELKDIIEQMTAFSVSHINLQIDDIAYGKNIRKSKAVQRR